MISAPDINLNPVEFDWNLVDSVMIPNKFIITLPEIYTVTCGSKKNALENVSQQLFFYKTITRLKNLQQTVTKIKKNKI